MCNVTCVCTRKHNTFEEKAAVAWRQDLLGGGDDDYVAHEELTPQQRTSVEQALEAYVLTTAVNPNFPPDKQVELDEANFKAMLDQNNLSWAKKFSFRDVFEEDQEAQKGSVFQVR